MRGTPQRQHQHDQEAGDEQVAPPGRQPAETDPARRLRRQAVSGDQLLLLPQRAKEAEGMRPKADNRHDREQQQRAKGARRHTRPLPPSGGGKHYEREHEPRRGLHADPHNEQCGCRPEVSGVHRNGDAPRARGAHVGFASRQRQRPGQDEQHERVVVRPAQSKLQQHGIQADEHGRHLG